MTGFGLPATQLMTTLTVIRDDHRWRGVEVSIKRGQQVLRGLARQHGGVVIDPDRDRILFLVDCETDRNWQLPGVTFRGAGAMVYIPADDLTTGPGRHWRGTPHQTTDADLLLDTLWAVTR